MVAVPCRPRARSVRNNRFINTHSGDYFRLWELINPDEAFDLESDFNENRPLLCRATLANVRKIGSTSQEFCAPLTSFDWNSVDASLCVTSSIDTTCTVWDMEV